MICTAPIKIIGIYIYTYMSIVKTEQQSKQQANQIITQKIKK